MYEVRLGHGGALTGFDVGGARPQPHSWPAVERRDTAGRRGLLDRIRGEFLEMRGLALTAREAARLLGVPPGACSRILHALIAEGSLRLTEDGRYTRPESTP